MATRTHGLTLDWLIGAKLVVANGSLVECSETHNSDLFWALRGAGSSFGVVAELKFDTFPTQRELTRFTLVTKWDKGTAAAGLATLQDFVFNAPRELNMMFIINSNGQQFVEGFFFGSQQRLDDLIAPLLGDTGARLARLQSLSWIEAQEYFAYGEPLDMTNGYNVTDRFYSKSAVTSKLAEAQLHQLSLHLFENFHNTSWPADTKWAYMMDLYGGPQSAVARSNALSTSFAHRDKFLVHQFSLRSTEEYVARYGVPLMTQFSDSLLRNLDDDDWGLYVNYVDPQIDAAKAPLLYYGSNLAKLESIKARVDGQDVFWNPHGVRPGFG
ncbi:hypothetical protein K4F52_002366 [Lecanicillium sp. MT-2017a]|nr:hypothetical protein K4F52_002366 [Lecanicillium sp. MT-2017a]